MELEQELVNFFISNTQYDRQFIYDLFNIIKNYIDKSVKVLVGVDHYDIYYYAITDNFHIDIHRSWSMFLNFTIVYKLTKINLVYKAGSNFDINICKIECIDEEKLKLHFDNSNYISFGYILMNLKVQECNKKLRDVFIPTSVKSARK